MKIFRVFLAAVLCFGASVSVAQVSKSITSTQCASIGVDPSVAVIGIQVTGTWTGTLQPQGVIQGQAPFNVLVTPSNSQTTQGTVTGNGAYFALVAGYSDFLLCGNTVASGTANVFLNISQATAGNGAGAPSSSFASLTPGTNTNGAMHVGSGSTLDATGTGTITATSLAFGTSGLVTSGLLAVYPLTEGTGTTITDATGNGNTGTFCAGSNAPTWIAGTGGLAFNGVSQQCVTLPAALNVAQTILLVTYFDPSDTNNRVFGSPISPATNVYPVPLMFSSNNSGVIWNVGNPSGPLSYTPEEYGLNGLGQYANGLGYAAGYNIFTTTIAAGGDTIYNYNQASTGPTIGTLASSTYQLGGGHPVGASQFYNGQILFAAFWSGTLTAAQVSQNVQAVEGELAGRGLVLNGQPGGGTWQTPVLADTFGLDGDSLTYLLGPLETISGSPNIFNTGYKGLTTAQVAYKAPYQVDALLPNVGPGGFLAATVGQSANKAGLITFIANNDEGNPTSQPLGAIARYCRDRHKAGWQKVFVTTKMSETGVDSNDTFKTSWNPLIRQYWSSWADGMIDLGAVYPLGANLASHNTYYFPDNVHWTSATGQALSGWIYSYAIRRMYGNTVNGTTPNTASTSVYLAVPEDIFLLADTTSNSVDVYLPPAQFFTGQNVTVKALAGGTNILTLRPKPVVSGTISATSLTSTTLTVTVSNHFLAGDVVVFAGLNTNTTKNGFAGTIATSSATQFTMTVTAASWSGSDTTGTATLGNMSQFAAITNLSLTTNVATITATNNFSAGDTVVLTGLTHTAGLNGTSAAVSGTGLSASSFQIPITHADIVSAAETGYAYKTYPAETIDGGATLVQGNGKTVTLQAQNISNTAAGANWIVLDDNTQSLTRCSAVGTAASPSVVSCGAAAAGNIYCDVAASGGTCTVNTTAITSTSVVLITPNAADGTQLSKTCNSSPSVVPFAILATKSGGTSFSINMPTLITNGACFEYQIF